MQKLPPALAAALIVASAHFAAAGDAPSGWRMNGTGALPAATPPTHWSPQHNVAWSTPLPSWSNAQPAIAEDRLFVTSEPSTLVCVQADDGRILWQRTNTVEDAAGPDHKHPTLNTHEDMNGYTTATPVTDGRHVWAVFGNAVVACYSREGERRWIRKMPDHPHEMFGHSASPLLVGNRLIVTLEDTVALNAETGEELWRAKYGQSWGSPVHVRIGDVDLAALANGRFVRVSDGKVVGRAPVNLSDSSPVVDGNRVYYIQSRGGAVQLPDQVGEKLELKRLWQTDPKGTRFYASPVVHEGLIYTISGNAILNVIDAADGAVLTAKRLDFGGGTIYPSLCLAGTHLFATSDNGTTIVLTTGRDPQTVAANPLAERMISTPAFAGTRIFLRTRPHLWCIESGPTLRVGNPVTK